MYPAHADERGKARSNRPSAAQKGTIRIVGAENGILKVSHTRYLMESVGLRLSVAKAITNDILEDKPREIEVPREELARHVEALQRIGARIEVVSIERAA